jgi:hypothetical protein
MDAVFRSKATFAPTDRLPVAKDRFRASDLELKFATL